MKYIRVLIFSYILIAFNAFADCTLLVRVTDYIPQYYQDDSGKWKGISIELLEALLNEANCKPIYKKTPWKRALSQLKYGKLDMMLNLSMTDERKEFLYFIGPQRDESIVLIVRDDFDFKINTFDDFKKLPKKIGIDNGAYYGKSFDSKYKNDPVFALKFHKIINTDQHILMLNLRRTNGFFGDSYNMAYKIKTQEIAKKLKIYPFIVNQESVYFGLSKKSVSKELQDKLQIAYEAVKLRGGFEEILARYR